jgi:hypothetical protein
MGGTKDGDKLGLDDISSLGNSVGLIDGKEESPSSVGAVVNQLG